MVPSITNELNFLYSLLPEVTCRACGECCVSPTCTAVEFIYLINHVTKTFGKEYLKNKILESPILHPVYPFNLTCSFIENHQCAIHAGRTGACRLFGVPSINEMGIEEMVSCKYEITIKSGRGDLEYIHDWLDKLVALNQKVHPYGVSPYFVRGFNIATWIDLYFDDTITIEPFCSIQNFLHDTIDLRWIISDYKITTGLKEKIDKITLLDMMLSSSDTETLKSLILSIRDGYPLTGSYYFEEAQMFLEQIDNITTS